MMDPLKADMGMSEIYLIRHGQGSFGKDNYDRLSTKGEGQTRLMAEYLFRTGVRFDSLYTGTLQRQTETARLFRLHYDGMGDVPPEPRIIPEFNEYDSPGILHCLVPAMLREDPSLTEDLNRIYTDKKSFQRVFDRAMLRWVTGLYETPGVERWDEFKARTVSAMKKIMEENGRGRTVGVFTSGGPISATVQMAAGLPDDETMRLCWQIVNTSVTRFRYTGERMTLSSFNVYSHLETPEGKELLSFR